MAHHYFLHVRENGSAGPSSVAQQDPSSLLTEANSKMIAASSEGAEIYQVPSCPSWFILGYQLFLKMSV